MWGQEVLGQGTKLLRRRRNNNLRKVKTYKTSKKLGGLWGDTCTGKGRYRLRKKCPQ